MIAQRVRFLMVAATLAMGISMQAHPGHAPLSQGAAHFMTSPYHLAAALMAAAALWVIGSLLKQQTAKLILRGAGVVMALGSVAMWSLGV